MPHRQADACGICRLLVARVHIQPHLQRALQLVPLLNLRNQLCATRRHIAQVLRCELLVDLVLRFVIEDAVVDRGPISAGEEIE